MDALITNAETTLAPLYDHCQLLQNILHDVLKLEVGEDLAKTEKLLALSKAAVDLELAGDEDAAALLHSRLCKQISELSLDESIFLTRLCGHYLNLTGLSESAHMLRCARAPDSLSSIHNTFETVLRKGFTHDDIYNALCSLSIDIVLTAHPTQVVRRSLQHKHICIGELLREHESIERTVPEKAETLTKLMREVMALWQTDELRRQKPTPVDEARAGLHIVEQSLWHAVPKFLRKLNAAVRTLTDRDLPITCNPISFGSWMGGDRDGNPNVTASVTQHVAFLSRWMAVDLYIREVEKLSFELSMFTCSDDLWEEAQAIKAKQQAAKEALVADEVLSSMSSLTLGRPPAMRKSIGNAPNSLSSSGPRSAFASPLASVADLTSKLPRLTPPPRQLFNSDSSGSQETPVGAASPPGIGFSTPAQNMQRPLVPLNRRPCGLLYKKDTPQNDWSRMSHAVPDDIVAEEEAKKVDIKPAPPGQLKGQHKGQHPYRVVLNEVRRKLTNTKIRMEALLAKTTPDDSLDWFDSEDEMARILQLCYWSLWECGAGMVADGRLLDCIRRLYTFGLSLLKMDIRQEKTRHTEVLAVICKYLDYGDYAAWSEAEKMAWLTKELVTKRPLLPPSMEFGADTKEVLDTFRLIAELGPRALGAYVISMASAPSDVLAVVLLQKEARLQAASEHNVQPSMQGMLRVVPLFETLEDLEGAPACMEALFSDPWYLEHIRSAFDNHQEVMLGYSDSGKDAGRLAANWALYTCQERLVAVAARYDVTLTLFHGRGGSIGRGGGPMHIAILGQPAGSIQGRLRVTEQGEMVSAKFGTPEVAKVSLEDFTTAVLQATLMPPSPPRSDLWRTIMEELGAISCTAYRDVVFRNPNFLKYFEMATPEAELGALNIGSRPARRRAADAGVNSLRAIPWIFAWTQTRHILPSWLGVGEALAAKLATNEADLIAMYKKWPFFQSTVDLIEMTLAKANMNVASMYDKVLVKGEDVIAVGAMLREKYKVAELAIKRITGHKQLCDNNSTLRSLMDMRRVYTDPVNYLQVEVLRRVRENPDDPLLRDCLLLTINGIAAGLRNTG